MIQYCVVCMYTCNRLSISPQANALRNAHKIYVSGADIPDAVASFDDLYKHYLLPSYLQRNITTAGYLTPTPIQMQTIPLMLHVS